NPNCNMDSLPPIPTPVAQRWREFRIRALPLFFFVAILAGVAVLWREVAIPPTLAVGFVETNGAVVSAPMDGQVMHMAARRFQQVKAGDQICQIMIKDPKILTSEIAVIQADIEKIKATMAPIVDEERARLAYYQLRLDVMKEQGIQAVEKIQLRQAREDFTNAVQLVAASAMATNTFEQVRTRMG